MDEEYRLSVLAALDMDDGEFGAALNSIAAIAHNLSDCDGGYVSLVDADRQWFKAKSGLHLDGGPRAQTFCHHAILDEAGLVVSDAAADMRFEALSLVREAPGMRFYSGMPIRVSILPGAPGAAIGTVCVMAREARPAGDGLMRGLAELASLASNLVESHHLRRLAMAQIRKQAHVSPNISRAHRIFVQAEKLANMGWWRLDTRTGIVEWSDQLCVIHGREAGAQPSLQEALEYYRPDDRERVSAAIAHTLLSGEPFSFAAELLSADGQRRQVHCTGELDNFDGHGSALIGLCQDVTSRHAIEEALRRSANVDYLTGIANRGQFEERLQQHLMSGATDLALALIDLDGFKAINDRHGHLAGDELLQQVARRLDAPRRERMLAGRLGGDEFGLMIEARQGAAFDKLIARILGDLAWPFTLSAESVSIAGSMGIAWLKPGELRRDLFHRADRALYRAKALGKGIACIDGQDSVIEAAPPPPGGRRREDV